MAEIRRRIVSRPFQKISSNTETSLINDDLDVEPRCSLSPISGLVVFVLWFTFIFTTAIYFNDKLPFPDTSITDKLQFNTDNVINDLKVLNGIGPKVTGSYENEYKTVSFLKNRISDIKNGASPNHYIIDDLQMVSGNFFLQIFSSSPVISYKNIQNIVVKIGPKVTSNSSLLINCHFDSVPSSPGASDDGLNCAMMLEIFRILSISQMELPHNVIFLFNGAEENPLIGSHGFITKHKWAHEVKTFINLESCGAGGREVLFQAGPFHPWLVETYGKAAKYPSGLVIAEEIFQSGIIPSDTDFRIFRDFGHIPGLDFAHCKNGYVYHTKLDNFESIDSPHGVIKHTGENILSLSKALLFSKEFIDPHSYRTGKQVYFDVFGIIFINYSENVGTFLNIATSLISIFGIYLTFSNFHFGDIFDNISKLSMAVASLLASLIIANSYSLFIGIALDWLGYSMSWYTNTGFIIVIYALPTAITMAINTIVVDKWILENVAFNTKIKISCLSVQLLWTIFLFSSTFLGVRSSCLLLIMVLPCALWTLITSLLCFRGHYGLGHMFFILISSFSSAMFCYLAITCFRLFIPITGRMGVSKNPELLIGTLTTLFSIAVISYVSTLFLHVRKQWTVIKVLLSLHIMSFVFVISPVGFPFSTNTPQRISITHVNRQFFDPELSLEHSDSLFWIQNMERRGRKVLPFLHDAQLLDEFCEKNGYCGLPWFSKITDSAGSTCIPSSPHELIGDSYLELISKQINETDFYLEFEISGSDHMGVIITPSKNIKLLEWNMPSLIDQSLNKIVFVQGLFNSSQTITLKALKELPDSFIKIELYGLYFHHNKHYSSSFNKLLSIFPEWSHTSPALAVYKSYIFQN